MRKYTSIFLALAAFFFVALAITAAYKRAPKAVQVETVHPVALLADHADPTQLIIKTKEKVRFDNGDGIDHNMQEAVNGESSTSSFSVPPGQSTRVDFNQAGTFVVTDSLHPSISVKIIVYDPSK